MFESLYSDQSSPASSEAGLFHGDRVGDRVQAIKQSDVARAIRAAIGEGLIIERIEVEGERLIVVTNTPERHVEMIGRDLDDAARRKAAVVSATATALIASSQKKNNDLPSNRAAWTTTSHFRKNPAETPG